MRAALTLLRYVWALPYTAVGAGVGLAGLCTGGGMQIREGVLEFHGGAARWLVSRMPAPGGAMAMTFGHTVLAQSAAALDVTREHEHVHVRQYERWGPFFGPAYVLASLLLWLRWQDPYRDNPFEREAFDVAGCVDREH